MEPEATHSAENTQAIVKEFRDFIDEAGEATELDMWTEVHTDPQTNAVWVQVDNGDLSYKITVTPID